MVSIPNRFLPQVVRAVKSVVEELLASNTSRITNVPFPSDTLKTASNLPPMTGTKKDGTPKPSSKNKKRR
jgi:hypothetical protein